MFSALGREGQETSCLISSVYGHGCRFYLKPCGAPAWGVLQPLPQMTGVWVEVGSRCQEMMGHSGSRKGVDVWVRSNSCGAGKEEGFARLGAGVSRGDWLNCSCARLLPTSAASFSSGCLSHIHSGADSASLFNSCGFLGESSTPNAHWRTPTLPSN